MRSTITFLMATLSSFVSFGQASKFSIEGHYGLAGNFFVRSYDEDGGPALNKKYFYQKKFLGSMGGLELKYSINKNSGIGIAYSREIHKGKKNFVGTNNNVEVSIQDFNIRHSNDFFQAYYERNFKKTNPAWKYHAGLVVAYMQQQEMEYYPNAVIIHERNFKNSRLNEGGVFGGIQYSKKIDTHFDFGIKARVYYLISVQQLETITLTPTLTYYF